VRGDDAQIPGDDDSEFATVATMWSARLVAMRTKGVHIAVFLAAIPMLASAADARAAVNPGFDRALVPAQVAFLTPPFPSAAEASSSDAVTSQGVARIGADALQATGLLGAGVKIAVLDQAFGATSRLDSLAGSELPPLDRQHRQSFDATYGLAGRDYNANSSRHGEFVSEIVYDIAPDADYWFVNYHTPDEFQQAVDYLRDVVHPDIVVHSNSFLFGPFDGTGWFAQQVDALAAQGTIWVNSAGNYRENHWEGPWADADGDGFLDIPGHGDDIPVVLAGTVRPACDLTASGTGTVDALNHYALGLFLDAAGTQPVLDAKSGQPMISAFVPLPTPHDDLGPGFLSAPATYHLRIMKVGNPPTEHLTLFCRFALPADVQVTSSSIPTPGDASGSFTIGAFDTTTLEPEPYSSEGPTDDGRPEPDLAAPTNVAITGGSCGGTSCATPHAAGVAALLLGSGMPAASIVPTLESWALDAGDPGFDSRFGAGRLRVDLTAPALGSPTVPAAGSTVSGVLNLRLPLVEAGTLDTTAVTLDGLPVPTIVGTDHVVSGSIDTRLLQDGPHVVRIDASDRVGNAGFATIGFAVDNTRPTLRLAAPATVLQGDALHLTATATDLGSGLAGPPFVRFGDGATARGAHVKHRFARPGRFELLVTSSDRAGNAVTQSRRVRVVALLVEPAAGDRAAIFVRRARPGPVRVLVAGKPATVVHVGRSPQRIALGKLARGVHRVVVVAGAARATRLVRVR
jgi:PKD domain/Subtilase family